MGIFDRFFRSADGYSPRRFRSQWEGLRGRERTDKALKPLLEGVAAAVSAESPVVVPDSDGDAATLRGRVDGQPFQVNVNGGGSVKFEIRYDEELETLDLRYDADSKPAEVAAWKPDEQRILLGPGVSVFGSQATAEKAIFEALPGAIRQRILVELAQHGVSDLRSTTGETTARLTKNVSALDDPLATIAAVVGLAKDLAKARGAEPAPLPGSPVDPQRPFAGWRQLSQDEKWARAVAFAEGVAKRTGGRVHASRKERELETRWVDGGAALRVMLELGFLHVMPGAMAEDTAGTFELWRDPKISVDERHVGDRWDRDGFVFFAPSIFLRGDEEDVRAEAAVLRSLPEPLLTELLATMERHSIDSVSLDEGTLDVRLNPFCRTDDGSTAIEVARLLGRIVAALPEGEAPKPVLDQVVRCKFCRALWFPSPTKPCCTHCGAPA